MREAQRASRQQYEDRLETQTELVYFDGVADGALTCAVVAPWTVGSMNTWIETFGILVKRFEVLRQVQILKRIPAGFDSIGIARDDRFIGFAVPRVTHADNSIWNERERE